MIRNFLNESKKLILSIILIIFIVIIASINTHIKENAVFASAEWDGASGTTIDATYTFSGGVGTEELPYLIATPEDLATLASNVNGGLTAYSTAYYQLTDNILLNDETFTFNADTGLVVVTDGTYTAYIGSGILGDNSGSNSEFDTNASVLGEIYIDTMRTIGNYGGTINIWTSIGSAINKFNGKFDGNGYKILGLYINTEVEYQGLFRHTGTNAVIKDIKLVDSCIKSLGYTGSIVGYNEGEISDCINSSIILSNQYTGGIAGHNTGSIFRCSNSGLIIGSSNTGGICGHNIDATLENNNNTGNVVGATDVGGILGSNDANSMVKNNYNSASVKGFNNVGGVVGNNSGTVSNNHNDGVIEGSSYVGGVVGQNTENSALTNGYNIGSITGNIYTGGVIGGNAGTVQYCYYLVGCAKNGENITQNGIGNPEIEEATVDTLNSTMSFNENAELYSDITVGTYTGNSLILALNYWLYDNYGQTDYYWIHDIYPTLVLRIFFDGGNGTQEQPYLISNANQLKFLSQLINEGYSNWLVEGESVVEYGYIQSACYQLTANIYLNDESFTFDEDTGLIEMTDEVHTAYIGTGIRGVSGGNLTFDYTESDGGDIYLSTSSDTKGTYSGIIEQWVAIGTNSAPFSGEFNGAGYTISGLYTNESVDYQGLFGVVSSGTASSGKIYNTSVVNSYVKGYNKTGGIVGSVYEGIIESCYYDGFIIGLNQAVGGVVGFAENNSIIQNCNNASLVKGHYLYVGGVIGNVQYSTVDNCLNSGFIHGESNSYGGIVGNNNNSTIKNSCNTGEMWNPNRTGGIAGYSYNGVVQNSYNTGNIEGLGVIGGIVGLNSSASLVENSYNIGFITGNESVYVGAVVGQNSGGTIVDNYYLSGTAKINPSSMQNGIGQIDQPIDDVIGVTTSFDTNSALVSAVTINEIEYTNLVDALNSWVSAQSNFSSWKVDTEINNNYPVFNECYLSVNIKINGSDALENAIVNIMNLENNTALLIDGGVYKAKVYIGEYDLYVNGVDTGIDFVITDSYSAIVYLYSLDYNANGASGTIPETAYYAEGAVVSVWDGNTLTKEGYSLQGFNTDSQENSTKESITMPNEQSILYALFNLKAPVVNINDNSQPLTFGDSISATYTHELDNDLSASVVYEWKVDGIYVSNENSLLLFANESAYEVSCTITFNVNEDSSSTTISKNYFINKKQLTVIDTIISEKVYDGNTTAVVSSNGELIGLVANYENVYLSVLAEFQDKMVGNNKNVSVSYSLSGDDSSNYTVDNTTLNSNITAKQLTVTWLGENESDTDFNWTYNNVEHAPTASVDTEIVGETIELIVSGKAINASQSAYTATVAMETENNNYTLSGTTKEFYIDKADYDMSSVTFEDQSYEYNGASQTLSIVGTLPTGLDGIQLTVSYSGSAKDVDDGYVAVTATFETSSPNYNEPKSMIAQVSITAKQLTVTWLGENESDTDFIWTYNNVEHAPTASVDTEIVGETIELIVSGKAINASQSAYTATVAMETENNNYTLSGTTKEFYIDKADYDMSSVIFEDQSYEYNGASQTLSIVGTLPTGLDGIQLTVSYSGSAKDVDDGYVTVTATFETSSPNYNEPKSMMAQVSITAKQLTVTWLGENESDTDFNWTYNNVEHAPTASVDTEIVGEIIELIVSGKAINASQSAYTATVAMETENNNYTLSGTTKEFYIDKTDYDMSSVTFEDQSYEYNGASQTLSIVGTLPTGLDGIQLTVSYSGSAKDVDDGYVTVTATFETSSPNYNEPSDMIAQVSIIARIVELKWVSNNDLTYDKQNKIVSAEVLNIVSNDDCNVSVSITEGSDNLNVGSFNCIATALSNNNYTLNGCENVTSPIFNITPRKVTITAQAKEIIVGENDVALTYTAQGLLEGDSVNGSLERESGTEPGRYNITIGSIATQNNNYVIDYVGAVYTIKALIVETTEKVNDDMPKAVASYENGIDPEAQLVLRVVPQEELDPRIVIEKGKKLIEGYEIELLIEDEPIEMEGNWTVSFVAPSDIKEGQECEILVLENGKLLSQKHVVKNGYITFDVTTQEGFAVVDSESSNVLILSIIVSAIIVIEIVMIIVLSYIIRKTKKKH